MTGALNEPRRICGGVFCLSPGVVCDITKPVKRTLPHIAWLLILTLLASGCSLRQEVRPGSTPARWQCRTPRLDPADGENADGDLIAGSGSSGKQIQVRLDLLNSDVIPQHDLYLAIDSQPGGRSSLPGGNTAGIAWDWLVYLPAQGHIQVLESSTQGQPSGIYWLCVTPTSIQSKSACKPAS